MKLTFCERVLMKNPTVVLYLGATVRIWLLVQAPGISFTIAFVTCYHFEKGK